MYMYMYELRDSERVSCFPRIKTVTPMFIDYDFKHTFEVRYLPLSVLEQYCEQLSRDSGLCRVIHGCVIRQHLVSFGWCEWNHSHPVTGPVTTNHSPSCIDLHGVSVPISVACRDDSLFLTTQTGL